MTKTSLMLLNPPGTAFNNASNATFDSLSIFSFIKSSDCAKEKLNTNNNKINNAFFILIDL